MSVVPRLAVDLWFQVAIPDPSIASFPSTLYQMVSLNDDYCLKQLFNQAQKIGYFLILPCLEQFSLFIYEENNFSSWLKLFAYPEIQVERKGQNKLQVPQLLSILSMIYLLVCHLVFSHFFDNHHELMEVYTYLLRGTLILFGLFQRTR